MEVDIGKTMQAIHAGLTQLAIVPAQFRACAEQTAQQIAGVVAAIQSHDITRQQTEHVQHALQIIGWRMTGDGTSDDSGYDLSVAYAGLTIQSSQLKTIQQIVSNWTSQVRSCLGGIQQLSAAQVARIGALVLDQERDLSSQLARIEKLQQESQDYGRTIQDTLGGLSSLLELVNESLGQSQEIRHRLRLSHLQLHRGGEPSRQARCCSFGDCEPDQRSIRGVECDCRRIRNCARRDYEPGQTDQPGDGGFFGGFEPATVRLAAGEPRRSRPGPRSG